MLYKIDDYLFDAKFGAQNISNWWQETTGLTNFWLAKWMYVCTTLLTAFLLITWFVSNNMPIFFNSILLLFLIFFFISMICHVYISENKYKGFTKNDSSVMNKERIRGRKERFLLLIATSIFFTYSIYFFIDNNKLIFKIFIIAYFLMQVFCLLGSYFDGCTPLPPGKSKVKKLYEKVLCKIDEKLSKKSESVSTFLRQ